MLDSLLQSRAKQLLGFCCARHLELHPVAELDVTLIEIQDVMKTDVIGRADPFCMFFVRQKADKIKRSSTKKNKKTAVWNEGFIIEVLNHKYINNPYIQM
jgi:Ca2+-dependent lipid-binding protein